MYRLKDYWTYRQNRERQTNIKNRDLIGKEQETVQETGKDNQSLRMVQTDRHRLVERQRHR